MTIILETRNIGYRYGDGTDALNDVSISLEEGRKIALVGPNGAGKSTLMLMFNGILRPSSGEVLFHGQPLQYDSSHLREIRRKVGMVFQNFKSGGKRNIRGRVVEDQIVRCRMRRCG